jgi:hypothetical protein
MLPAGFAGCSDTPPPALAALWCYRQGYRSRFFSFFAEDTASDSSRLSSKVSNFRLSKFDGRLHVYFSHRFHYYCHFLHSHARHSGRRLILPRPSPMPSFLDDIRPDYAAPPAYACFATFD